MRTGPVPGGGGQLREHRRPATVAGLDLRLWLHSAVLVTAPLPVPGPLPEGGQPPTGGRGGRGCRAGLPRVDDTHGQA